MAVTASRGRGRPLALVARLRDARSCVGLAIEADDRLEERINARVDKIGAAFLRLLEGERAALLAIIRQVRRDHVGAAELLDEVVA